MSETRKETPDAALAESGEEVIFFAQGRCELNAREGDFLLHGRVAGRLPSIDNGLTKGVMLSEENTDGDQASMTERILVVDDARAARRNHRCFHARHMAHTASTGLESTARSIDPSRLGFTGTPRYAVSGHTLVAKKEKGRPAPGHVSRDRPVVKKQTGWRSPRAWQEAGVLQA